MHPARMLPDDGQGTSNAACSSGHHPATSSQTTPRTPIFSAQDSGEGPSKRPRMDEGNVGSQQQNASEYVTRISATLFCQAQKKRLYDKFPPPCFVYKRAPCITCEAEDEIRKSKEWRWEQKRADYYGRWGLDYMNFTTAEPHEFRFGTILFGSYEVRKISVKQFKKIGEVMKEGGEHYLVDEDDVLYKHISGQKIDNNQIKCFHFIRRAKWIQYLWKRDPEDAVMDSIIRDAVSPFENVCFFDDFGVNLVLRRVFDAVLEKGHHTCLTNSQSQKLGNLLDRPAVEIVMAFNKFRSSVISLKKLECSDVEAEVSQIISDILAFNPFHCSLASKNYVQRGKKYLEKIFDVTNQGNSELTLNKHHIWKLVGHIGFDEDKILEIFNEWLVKIRNTGENGAAKEEPDQNDDDIVEVPGSDRYTIKCQIFGQSIIEKETLPCFAFDNNKCTKCLPCFIEDFINKTSPESWQEERFRIYREQRIDRSNFQHQHPSFISDGMITNGVLLGGYTVFEFATARFIWIKQQFQMGNCPEISKEEKTLYDALNESWEGDEKFKHCTVVCRGETIQYYQERPQRVVMIRQSFIPYCQVFCRPITPGNPIPCFVHSFIGCLPCQVERKYREAPEQKKCNLDPIQVYRSLLIDHRLFLTPVPHEFDDGQIVGRFEIRKISASRFMQVKEQLDKKDCTGITVEESMLYFGMKRIYEEDSPIEGCYAVRKETMIQYLWKIPNTETPGVKAILDNAIHRINSISESLRESRSLLIVPQILDSLRSKCLPSYLSDDQIRLLSEKCGHTVKKINSVMVSWRMEKKIYYDAIPTPKEIELLFLTKDILEKSVFGVYLPEETFVRRRKKILEKIYRAMVRNKHAPVLNDRLKLRISAALGSSVKQIETIFGEICVEYCSAQKQSEIGPEEESDHESEEDIDEENSDEDDEDDEEMESGNEDGDHPVEVVRQEPVRLVHRRELVPRISDGRYYRERVDRLLKQSYRRRPATITSSSSSSTFSTKPPSTASNRTHIDPES